MTTQGSNVNSRPRSAGGPSRRALAALILGSLAWLAAPQGFAESTYPPVPAAIASFGGAVAGDALYVFGGHVGKTHSHSMDHLSHRFLRLELGGDGGWQDLPIEYGLQGVELISDGEGVIRIGGLSARNRGGEPEDLHSLASVSRFDPALGRWHPLPPLPAGRSSHGAAFLDGKLYVVGGWRLAGKDVPGEWQDTAYVLDLEAEAFSWRELPRPPFVRRALAVAAVNGRVYAIGGITEEDGISSRVDVFDVVENAWKEGPDLPIIEGLKGFGTAAFGMAGELYVSPADGKLYRLSRNGDRWEDSGPRMEPKRFFHRLLPRGGDRLLVVAGAGMEGHLSSIEDLRISELLPPGDPRTAIRLPGSSTWPAFRGDGSSRTQATDLPLAWTETENFRWSIELPGYGQSSPVIWKDRVFVTAVEGEEKETLILAALELGSGQEIWRKTLPASQRIPSSEMVSRAAPTPAVDGERVYAFFESGDLAAFSHGGELLWKRSLTEEYGPFQGNHGVGSSLALLAGAVVVLVQHEGPSYLLAVDRETGQNYWRTETAERVSWSTPLVLEGRQKSEILISSNGEVESYDGDSGELLWRVGGLERNTVASPSVHGDLVIIASAAGEHSMAVRRHGRGDVSASHVAWKAESAAANFSSPLVHDGCAYFVNRAGVARCLDPETGEEVWSHRLPGPCWASPIGAGDRVYFFTKDGDAVVLSSGTETPEVLATSKVPAQGPVYGVAAVDEALVVRTGRRLLRFGPTRRAEGMAR